MKRESGGTKSNRDIGGAKSKREIGGANINSETRQIRHKGLDRRKH